MKPAVNEIEKTLSKLKTEVKKPLHKKYVLVTGGAGYLGSVMVRKLLDEGFGVIVLDALYFGDSSIKPLLKHPDFIFQKGNIENIGDLSTALQKATYVIHLAGIVGDPACSVDPVFTIQTNFFSTETFIKMCKYFQIKKFIFASSCSVYGFNEKKLTEKSKTNPVSLYATSKLEAEKILLAEKHGEMEIIIMRMATLYGWSYRPRFDLVANLFAGKAAINEEIIVQGGNQRRPLLHIEDATTAYIKVLKTNKKLNSEIFNVGSTKENYTILEIANIVKTLNPKVIITIDNKVVDKRDYFVDFSKIEKTFNFKNKKSLKTSLNEIYDNVKNKKLNIRDPRYSNYLQVLNSRKLVII